MLQSRTSLLIHSKFNSLHLLSPNLQSIPPSPTSHLATTNLFSMSVSLFLFCKEIYLCHILGSTYKWYHRVFVFLFLTSLSMRMSSFIHVAANGIISFFFYGRIVFHCIDVPYLLNLFICWRTVRLFPCLGYCELCCCEHMGACIFLNCSFVWICVQEWDCWIIW